MCSMADDLDTIGGRLGRLISFVPDLDMQSVDRLAGLRSPGHTAQIVRGDKPQPAAATIVALARVLGASAEWLVEGGDAPSERRVRAAVKAARARVEGGGGHARAVRTASRPSKRARRAAGGA